MRSTTRRRSTIATVMMIATTVATCAWSQSSEKVLQKPDEAIIKRAVKVPMIDGVELVADVFLPHESSQRVDRGYPVILARTPYGRHIEATLYGEFFAKNGYVFAAQDVRGRFDSGGTWTPFRHERQDGIDTIDWLVQQEWCNGSVAMFGASYGAMCAWHVAGSGHENLLAVISMVNVADPDKFMPFDGGVFHIGFAGWAKLLETIDQSEGASPPPMFNWDKAARVRPLSEIDSFFGTSHQYVDELIAHPLSDREYWTELGYTHRLPEADVAGLHITGWFDVHRQGTFTTYRQMRERAAAPSARDAQFMVVGPWAHLGLNRTQKLGSTDFGEGSVINLDGMMVDFLDHYLRDLANGWNQRKRVKTFVLGANQWEESADWPQPNSRSKKLFLDSMDAAHRRGGGGRLLGEASSMTDRKFDEFVYSPDDPSSFLGSMALYPIAAHTSDKSSEPDRDDVLDYTSAPFAEPLDCIGDVSVVLHVSTSAADTDFCVELFRLTENGEMLRLTGGIRRLRFRNGYAEDSPVTPGEVVEMEIACPPIGVRLRQGDRLHLQIGSAAAPAFAPHLNTLEPVFKATKATIATNRVWHSGGRESFIEFSHR